MIRDIISFTLGEKKFAIDLLNTPLILSAEKYLPKKFSYHSNGNIFQFEGRNVIIINLHSIFGLKFNSISEKSKILVGYLNNEIFGLLVDQVNIIINLNLSQEENSDFELTFENSFIKKIINTSGSVLKVLDFEKIVSKLLKEKMDIEISEE